MDDVAWSGLTQKVTAGATACTFCRVPEQDVRAKVTIPAPADVLYAMVSDVTRMGEWSPENVAGRWLGGETTPAVGARFRGSNRRGWRRWSTTATVVAADPGRMFSFDVRLGPVRTSRWTYEFRPSGDGTVVEEIWSDHRPRWLAILAGATMGIDDIRAHNAENMRTTLDNLRGAASRAASSCQNP